MSVRISGAHRLGGAMHIMREMATPAPASKVLVSMLPASVGVYHSIDGGSTFSLIGSDPSWMGQGTMHGFGGTRVACNVGAEAPGGLYYPIAMWNGTIWTVDTGLITTYQQSDMWVSSDEVFAVQEDKLYRKSGGSWSTISDLPSPQLYTKVHGSSNSAVFICGQYGAEGLVRFVDKWDGAAISRIYTGPDLPGDYGMSRVIHSVSPTSVWYAWERGSDNNIVIEHWDGAAWSVKYNANHGYNPPTALWFADENHGWMTSGQMGGESGIPMLYWDGVLWSAQTVPMPLHDPLNAVHGVSASDVYACGVQSEFNHVLHYNGSSWSDITPALFAGLDPKGVMSYV